HQAARGSAETSIREERYRVAQPFAHDGSRDTQHFTHARAAFRTFIADHHHVASIDALASHRAHCIFFRLENARWSAMAQSFVATDLHYASLRRKIAVQDHQSARLLQRTFEGSNHFLAISFARSVSLFRERFSGDGKSPAIDMPSVEESLRNDGNSACFVDISCNKSACRLEISKQRSP